MIFLAAMSNASGIKQNNERNDYFTFKPGNSDDQQYRLEHNA